VTKYKHFVVVGEEDPQCHLASIKEKGAEEVIVIDTGLSNKDSLTKSLHNFGIPYRLIKTKNDQPITKYSELLEALHAETDSSFFGYDVSIIVNCSTGNSELVLGVMDFLLMQFFMHHHSNNDSPASLSRMILHKDKKTFKCRYYPVWNFSEPVHNAIMGNLMTGEKLNRKELQKRLEVQGLEIGSESFRKEMRKLMIHISRAPNFKEDTRNKAPKIGLDIEE
jgi:hypothetical protein